MPPMPKDPSTRARRNKTSTNSVLRVVPGQKVPALPKGTDWHPMAAAWWKTAWMSPMVQEWTEADQELLIVCLAARHAYWKSFDEDDRRGLPSMLNSIVSAEKTLGLSPMSRRALQWQIEQGEAAEEKTTQRRRARAAQAKPRPVESDPRELLA